MNTNIAILLTLAFWIHECGYSMLGIWVLTKMTMLVVAQFSDESRIVTIDSGSVRGYKDVDYDIFVFYGIPYATAPTGADRYKAPLPAPKWSYIFEATEAYIMCPQYQIVKTPQYVGESRREDCLIANVYVPNTTTKKLPVLVNVHGGNYQDGYGNTMTLKKLVDTKRVILVNFNYRLGVHGFLCLGTKDAPGNAGMKDMVALLRWIKKNIEAFGGNPNEVTISEYSARASIVDLLQLSPTTKGLFNRAIPESGPNLGTFLIQMDPLRNAKMFAKVLNFTYVNDIPALESFYKTIPFEILSSSIVDQTDVTLQFTPCVERDLGEEAFLLEAPLDILSKGSYFKVPILCGFTNTEGPLKLEFVEQWVNRIDKIFSELLPADLNFDTEEQREEVARSVKEFYFGAKLEDIYHDHSLQEVLMDYFSDVFFAYNIFRSVRLQVEAGNTQVYLYEYSLVDDEEEIYGFNIYSQGQGSVLYEAKNLGMQENKNQSEKLKKKIETVKELWLNFITTGIPVPIGSSLPPWPPVNAEGSPHMLIGESLELIKGPQLTRWRRMNFWHNIYDRHYRNPIPPPVHRSLRVEL